MKNKTFYSKNHNFDYTKETHVLNKTEFNLKDYTIFINKKTKSLNIVSKKYKCTEFTIINLSNKIKIFDFIENGSGL